MFGVVGVQDEPILWPSVCMRSSTADKRRTASSPMILTKVQLGPPLWLCALFHRRIQGPDRHPRCAAVFWRVFDGRCRDCP